ncbi:MAG: hypothetical protein V4691_06200 [Pseudomonadota bacterium]
MRKLLLTAAALLTLGATTPLSAKEIKFEVINKSKYDVNEIYASPAGNDSWGDDIFTEEQWLKTDQSANVTLTVDKADVCVFDLKFVFEDDGDKDETNNYVVEKNINLCETESYTLEDEK